MVQGLRLGATGLGSQERFPAESLSIFQPLGLWTCDLEALGLRLRLEGPESFGPEVERFGGLELGF